MSPKGQGFKQGESQSVEQRKSKNEQQQTQASQPGGKAGASNQAIEKPQKSSNESHDRRLPGSRFKTENEVVNLEQIGDLSEIVKEERTVNETIDERRMHDSADNINNTTEMIMELADRNFESLNSQESLKHNRNPPPSAQQNSQGITIPNNE